MSFKITTSTERKHHKPTPEDLLPMEDKYTDKSLPIDAKDVEILLERYSQDETVDLYTLCDTLNISRGTLYKLLKDERFQELYEHARTQRGAIIAAKGYQMAIEPFKLIKEGQDVSKEFVNAAKVASNYAFLYAKSFDKSLDNKTNKQESKGNTNIQINILNTDIKEKS